MAAHLVIFKRFGIQEYDNNDNQAKEDLNENFKVHWIIKTQKRTTKRIYEQDQGTYNKAKNKVKVKLLNWWTWSITRLLLPDEKKWR